MEKSRVLCLVQINKIKNFTKTNILCTYNSNEQYGLMMELCRININLPVNSSMCMSDILQQ